MRHTSCHILLDVDIIDSRCSICNDYQKNLFAMVSNRKQTSIIPRVHSSHVNYRFMSDTQKIERMQQLRAEAKSAKSEVSRLQKKLSKLTKQRGIEMDNTLQADLATVMKENTPNILSCHAEGSFQRIFWEHQLNATHTARSGMRWHALASFDYQVVHLSPPFSLLLH